MHDPRPLSGRDVGILMLAWTALVGGWLATTILVEGVRPFALVLAVAGLAGVV